MTLVTMFKPIEKIGTQPRTVDATNQDGRQGGEPQQEEENTGESDVFDRSGQSQTWQKLQMPPEGSSNPKLLANLNQLKEQARKGFQAKPEKQLSKNIAASTDDSNKSDESSEVTRREKFSTLYRLRELGLVDKEDQLKWVTMAGYTLALVTIIMAMSMILRILWR